MYSNIRSSIRGALSTLVTPFISVRSRLMLLFLLGAVTALSSCDLPSSIVSVEESRKRMALSNQAFETSCPIEDCSALPIGYHTVEIGGEWLYIPIPKWHAYREEDHASPVDVSIWPRTRHVAQYDLGEDVPRSRAELRTVTVGARTIEFGRCCSTYELLYDLPAGALDLGFGRLRISFPTDLARRDTPYTTEIIEALAVENGYVPFNDDFFIRAAPARDAPRTPDGKIFPIRAISKRPVLLGEPVTIVCFRFLGHNLKARDCNIQTGVDVPGPEGGIGPNSFNVTLDITQATREVGQPQQYCGGYYCESQEGREATLEIMLERVATMEKIFELFRQHPAERGRQ